MLSLLISLAVGPSVALAQDDSDARAFELFTNGRSLYNEGRYDQAVLAFEEAYKLSGRHELLLNIANAHERNGKLEKALEALARYQAFATSDERDQIERRKSMLEKKLAEQTTAPSPVPEPQPAPDPVAPTPKPQPEPVPEPARGGSGRTVLGGTLMGVGVAAVGAGAALGVVSAGAKKRASEKCVDFEGARICPGDAGKDLSLHRSTALTADIAFAVGIALAATGGLLIVTKKRNKGTAMAIGPSGVQLTGRW